MTESPSDIISNPNPYFKFSATLRIFGESVDFSKISKGLNLTPTKIIHRGDRRGVKSPPHRYDMWSYTAPVPPERTLDEHLSSLWQKIKLHKDFLLEIKKEFHVDVFCGYNSDSGIAGFAVSPASLELFTQLQIPFGVSVVVAIQ